MRRQGPTYVYQCTGQTEIGGPSLMTVDLGADRNGAHCAPISLGKTMSLHLVDQVSALSEVIRGDCVPNGDGVWAYAAAGLLRYRLKKEEQTAVLVSSSQHRLFPGFPPKPSKSSSPKYRRQSFHTSEKCGNEHVVPWNKSFGWSSCAYITGRCTAIQRGTETLPNRANLTGQFEAVRALMSARMRIQYLAMSCFSGG